MNLLEQIQSAGVVGCGGAGFPTHVKLAAKDVDTFLVNGAECEPLLGTDRWLMRNKASEIVSAVGAVRLHLGAARAVIALKETYTDEIAALRAAIEAASSPVELFLLKGFYPAGDEQVQVLEVTGRVVPPGGIPLDVGCVVSNAATMYAAYHALRDRPFTQKYLTVTGAVALPCVIKAPVGTGFAECLALAGGAETEHCVVVSGGPMMGQPMTMAEALASHVTKTTSGYLVLPEHARLWQKHVTEPRFTLNRARTACVQCSFCTQLCPRWLLGHPLEPHKIMRRMGGEPGWRDSLDDPVLRAAQYCCECGVCELVACPMELRPRAVNVMVKQALAERGLRPIKGTGEYAPREFRDERAIPTAKAAARAGAGPWYHTEPSRYAEAAPREVRIALNSHIGAPAVPIVKAGEHVDFGQCIAAPPEGKLGARYHASIAGTVTEAGESVVIRQ
ncbi:MAG: 4Fe-4S dicluster domain-containing protein [Oscillospiraceae bacterium]|nr:4Fe-4S dicluster domain-containing protein [Oscillospiraceae bacterium]